MPVPIIEIEPRPALKKKKKRFFWSNSYNIDVKTSFLREMLESPNFGHMTNIYYII